ncbi:MAG: phosphonate metabolism protein/1,5-bisphosphokinase (PRPP-forming) PhnN [Herminiimonas sp.]|nr:phosphonate metabolism protein/1,5-bisphosphokinase (PRPP-forming) PhnN [Herminiimonas sp.]
MTRYALYFAPADDSPWWSAGCRWLGRDASSGAEYPQRAIAGVSVPMLAKLTTDARRYGLHATLKPPFRLAEGFSEAHLVAMAHAFAAVQTPIVMQDVQVRPMGEFLALRPALPLEAVNALAMRCVAFFDLLRATPTAAELAKRRNAPLSPRQDALLRRWGYPYTEEEFRFHMTLTDSLAGLDGAIRQAVHKAAQDCFSDAQAAPLTIDALTIFQEESPGAPFKLWRRFGFQAVIADRAMPAPGRLFYFVGASGVGKDSLLEWVHDRMPASADLVFARRVITRAAHPSERHEPVTQEIFWQQAEAGQFSMMWQAHGLCYGVRRGIEADLLAGRDVVINGSREYVPQLMERFPDAQVVWVEADAALLAERIAGRARESGPALLRRIDRALQFMPPIEPTVLRIDNSGSIEQAGVRLMQILTRG